MRKSLSMSKVIFLYQFPDHVRGSYIDINILRDNIVINTVNLYDFLINDSIPKPQSIDGDTIIVKN